MKKHKLLLTALLCVSIAAQAQELHENVYVEGEYIPEVIKQDKIHLLPAKMNFTMENAPLPYTLTGRNIAYQPSIYRLQAEGWRTELIPYDKKGYVDLSMGSSLNTVLSAGYKAIDTDNTSLRIWLQHNSSSFFKPEDSDFITNGTQLQMHRRCRYDQSIGATLTTKITSLMLLDADLTYHLGYFNYYYDHNNNYSQSINDVMANVGLCSTPGSINWWARLGGGYYSYRSMYLQDYNTDYYRIPGSRQSTVKLAGGVAANIATGSSLGMDIDAVYLGYNKPLENDGRNQDYGNVRITPRYTYSNTDIIAEVGANIDLTMHAGKGIIYAYDRDYKLFHISPAVRLGYGNDRFGIELTASGGTHLNTLQYLHSLLYYNTPLMGNTLPSYSPVDAALRLRAGSFSGFSGEVVLKYATTKNIPFMDTYSTNSTLNGVNFIYRNLHGASLGLKLKYEYGTLFSVSAEGTYQNQKSKYGYFNGIDFPKYTANASIEFKPIKNIALRLDYKLRALRYTPYELYLSAADAPLVQLERLPNYATLNLGAKWNINNTFTVWGELNNLTNRINYTTLDLEEQRLNFLIGAGITF